MLQLERKIAMKWRFLHIRVVVFRFSRCQSSPFTRSKLCFDMLIVMLLSCKSYAFRFFFRCFGVFLMCANAIKAYKQLIINHFYYLQ